MANGKAESLTDRGAVWLELQEFWRQMPSKRLFFSLLAGWLILFQFLGNSTFGYVDTPSLFGWMYYVFSTSPDDDLGLLVPIVVVALFWLKRKDLLATPKREWWPGLALVGAGVLIHLLGFAVQQSRVSIVGFFTGLYGLMGMAWGPAWLRASFFPYVLFVFCIPLGTMADAITLPLRVIVARVAVFISQTGLGIDVLREGSQIFDSRHTFAYEVAPACSGIRSLSSLLALTIIYGFVTFRTNWKRVLIVLLAIPLAVLGNVLRLTGVIAVAEAFGQDAGKMVEHPSGFLTFAVSIAGLLGVATLLNRYAPEEPLPSRTSPA